MCLDDLWQWLSGTFEAHPISGFRFSFLVIYGTVDEFSLSADMFHNCQNFDWSGISEKKIIKGEKKSRLLHHIFTFLCPCPKLLWLEFAAPCCVLPVPSPCAPSLLWAFSGPDGKSCWQWRLENASQLSLQQSLGCIRVVGWEKTQSSSFPCLHGGVLCLVCTFIPQANGFLAAVSALQGFGYFGNLEICSCALKHSSWSSPGKSARDGSDLCICRLVGVVPCAYAAPQSCVSFSCRGNILSINCLLFSLLCPPPHLPSPCQWPLSYTPRLWVSECPSSQAATTHRAFCIVLRFCLRRWRHFKKVDGKSRLMINLL